MARRGKDLGALWHLLAGMCIAAAVSFGGWVREKHQHHWKPLSRHQKLEAAAWGAGAAVAGVAAVLWSVFG